MVSFKQMYQIKNIDACIVTSYFFIRSYNAIKAYIKEGRQTELSAGEHLMSAATAGQYWTAVTTVGT